MKTLNFFLLLFLPTVVWSFDNVTSGVGITPENEDGLRGSSLSYAIARQGQRAANNEELVQGFVEIDDYIYSVSSEPSLVKTKKEGRELLGNWPLTPWSNAVRMIGEGMHWDVRPELIAVKGGEYHAISEPKKMVFDFDSDYDLYTDNNYIGCYNKTPLRYGDTGGNTSNELVVFLNNDLVVFSPENQKIIFSAQLHTQDELTSNQVRIGFPELEETAPQYISEKGLKGKSRNARFPAMRSFAKIFIDDFNSDGKKDIIVWRKLYESRLKTDPVLGFKLEGELLVHYQLENGEYQLQTNAPAEHGEFVWDDTQQTEIKGWLDSKNLTWKKGFPSKSECAGQEGQLIPEMHDPLLNDPDVLK
ncbi:hypothetical protein QNI23_004315 [Bermanella sp. WJH001]|uniref:hypothetical protein n=1 Tax=Bermanella sp. WJH001 TaxID=3048005 RepID=UPI0024BDF210|nr:hypothetical protein [Bermanella sp. WJH001]MDJ1539708.1 hypothetical protein [Bermanella sp. WJH001]